MIKHAIRFVQYSQFYYFKEFKRVLKEELIIKNQKKIEKKNSLC